MVYIFTPASLANEMLCITNVHELYVFQYFFLMLRIFYSFSLMVVSTFLSVMADIYLQTEYYWSINSQIYLCKQSLT